MPSAGVASPAGTDDTARDGDVVISTPLLARTPKVSISSGERSAGSTPIQPRVTTPSLTMPSSTSLAVDTGMAKPMPMLPPERE